MISVLTIHELSGAGPFAMASLLHLDDLRRPSGSDSSEKFRQHDISTSHFVPDLSPPGNRIVGPAVGLGGKLILTVSFYGRLGLFGTSPAESKPIAVRIGGRGGIIEPDGFGTGFWSSGTINVQMTHNEFETSTAEWERPSANADGQGWSAGVPGKS